MQREYAKREMQKGRVDPPSAKDIRKLGLIPDQKPEDVDIKPVRWIPHKGPSIT